MSTQTTRNRVYVDTTFGMEVEYNMEEHDRFHHARWSWLKRHGEENELIGERGVSPCRLHTMLRRMCFLADTLGFWYDEGEDEDTAGSFHFHVQTPHNIAHGSQGMIYDKLLPVLTIAQQLKRSSDDQWRGAADYRSRFDSWGGHAPDDYELDINTKRYWVCWNDAVDTVEVRLNESPATYALACLQPWLMMNENPAYHISLEAFRDAVGSDLNGGIMSPSEIEGATQGIMGSGTWREMMLTCISDYAARGRLLPVRILTAVLMGATNKEIHVDVVLPTFVNTAPFTAMKAAL